MTFAVFYPHLSPPTDMVVSGVPKPNGQRHAREICNMSLDIRDACKTFVIPHLPTTPLQIRIGCHTGDVTAAILDAKIECFLGPHQKNF